MVCAPIVGRRTGVSCNVARRHRGLRLTERDAGAPQSGGESRHTSHFMPSCTSEPDRGTLPFHCRNGRAAPELLNDAKPASIHVMKGSRCMPESTTSLRPVGLAVLTALLASAATHAAEGDATAITIYSSAAPGAIPPEMYRPIPGSGVPNAM